MLVDGDIALHVRPMYENLRKDHISPPEVQRLRAIIKINKDYHDARKLVFLFHGRTRTACIYRCVWSGFTGR